MIFVKTFHMGICMHAYVFSHFCSIMAEHLTKMAEHLQYNISWLYTSPNMRIL